MVTRGRRYPAGPISVTAALAGLETGRAASAHRALTRRDCLSEAPFGRVASFPAPTPGRYSAAKSARSADRHSMRARRVPPAATRGFRTKPPRENSGAKELTPSDEGHLGRHNRVE